MMFVVIVDCCSLFGVVVGCGLLLLRDGCSLIVVC